MKFTQNKTKFLLLPILIIVVGIVMYFVQEGDTLWSIAKRYQTTVDNLKECNSLTDDTIITGQILRICRKIA
jgi:LysM repeat protein